MLTPHAGEAARLLACTPEEIQSDRPAAVRRIADRYQATVVLKGSHTLVAAPGRADVFECKAGNPFMALGGMGDLLSGALAARWAYLSKTRPDPDAAFLAACAAVPRSSPPVPPSGCTPPPATRSSQPTRPPTRPSSTPRTPSRPSAWRLKNKGDPA